MQGLEGGLRPTPALAPVPSGSPASGVRALHLPMREGTHHRKQVFERDRGVCWSCGRDTEQIRAHLQKLLHGTIQATEEAIGTHEAEDLHLLSSRRHNRCVRFLEHLGFESAKVWTFPNVDRTIRVYWEMHHEKAVSDGGAGEGLENLRTVCVPCHKEITRGQSKRRASKRRYDRRRRGR